MAQKIWLTCYSDAAATERDHTIVPPNKVYFEGKITLKEGQAAVYVTLALYEDDGTFITALMAEYHVFQANIPVKISTILGSIPEYTTAANKTGMHYAELAVSHANIQNEKVYCGFEVMAAPIIGSPAFDDITITQDQEMTLTVTLTNTTDAMVVFLNGDGDICYQQEISLSGTTGTAVIPPGSLPVREYSAGDIYIMAFSTTTNFGAKDDSTLTLTVSAGSKTFQHRLATSIISKIKADARFDSITDTDVTMIAQEDEILMKHKYPAVCVLPLSDEQAREMGTISYPEHRIVVIVYVAVEYYMENVDDMTEPDNVHEWMQSIMDLVEEQSDDPDQRFGLLVDWAHAEKSEPWIGNTNSGDIYVGEIKVVAAAYSI